MIPMIEPMLKEFREEAAITKRVLDRVPGDKLSWRPHPKSMSLGQLAIHTAGIPGGITKLAQLDEFDNSRTNFMPTEPSDVNQIHTTLEEGVRAADDYLNNLTEEKALGRWRMVRHGKEIVNLPRVAVIRTVMLNHWYHHRGQLSVYLRLLDVPVPAIYGRSADDNPLG
ncbi:MAG TPA: DinB family protein [Terriglobales bacterium]|nr:DinB family protein [Terriglobales bacterium]